MYLPQYHIVPDTSDSQEIVEHYNFPTVRHTPVFYKILPESLKYLPEAQYTALHNIASHQAGYYPNDSFDKGN